ncbi:MAG TPA: DUF302 domain-containing protein [Gemmatimonadales bacterium]
MQISLVPDVRLAESHDDAIAKVTAALKEQGFGVLTSIDIRSAFQERLGKEFRPYTILGACNPPLAHAALTSDPLMGLMLPCNVTVEAAADGGSIVRFANPEAMLSVGGALTHPSLNQVAADATARLAKVAEALKG